MKLKETVTAPIPVLVTYGLYCVCYATPLAENALKGYGDYTLISGIVMLILTLIIPALFYSKFKGIGFSSKMRFAHLNPSRSIFAICALICALSGVILITVGMNVSGAAEAKYSLLSTYSLSVSDAGLPVVYRMFAYAIIPAMCEEFLYRGVLFTEYRNYGVICAAVFSTVLFTMGQFSITAIPAFLFIGAVMAFVYYITDSFILTVCVRVLFNIAVFFFEGATWTLIIKRTNFVFFVTLMAIIFFVFLALGLAEAQRSFYKSALDGEKTPDGAESGRKVPEILVQALFSPTFVLCLAAFVAIILLT